MLILPQKFFYLKRKVLAVLEIKEAKNVKHYIQPMLQRLTVNYLIILQTTMLQ